MAEDLPIWVIYDSPRDHPGRFVARLWIGEEATDTVLFATRIKPLRARLQRAGLVRLERHMDDDPVIVETWL